MRALEIDIVCLVLLSLATVLLSSRLDAERRGKLLRRIRFALLGMLVAALALHLAIEGDHWQMAPAYLALLLTVPLLLSPLRIGGRIAGAIASALLVALTCGLSWMLPMFSFPAPTGSFAIGTRILSMVDESRMEDLDPASGRHREVVVQIWYPALPSRNPLAPYRRRSETTLASSYQSVDWTHSRTNAPVANSAGGFPILLYNPGWGDRRTQDTMLTEDLASHGYVVVAIDHPYNAARVELEDGRVIRALPPPAAFGEQATEADVYAYIHQELDRETSDTLFVLDRVERLNGDTASPFYHRLDLSRIGAFGFSMGAMVAAESAWRDDKIHAVVDLDTPLYGESGKNGLKQPFMLLSEDIRYSTPEELARMTTSQRRDAKMDDQDYRRELPMFQKPGNYEIALHGAKHNGFQDAILDSPLQSITYAGSIPPRRMIPILRQYLLAFFDQSLRGIPSPLLAAKVSPFPEATALYPSPAPANVPAATQDTPRQSP